MHLGKFLRARQIFHCCYLCQSLLRGTLPHQCTRSQIFQSPRSVRGLAWWWARPWPLDQMKFPSVGFRQIWRVSNRACEIRPQDFGVARVQLCTEPIPDPWYKKYWVREMAPRFISDSHHRYFPSYQYPKQIQSRTQRLGKSRLGTWVGTWS